MDGLKSQISMADCIRLMWDLFVSRRDVFAVQVQRGADWVYQPVRRPLTDADIVAHLEGRITLGAYPASSYTPWLCIDIDSRDLEVLGGLVRILETKAIPFCLEDSGSKGWHLWVFWEKPLANEKAREIGRALTTAHEIFPKQNVVPAGRLGNLIKLPLGIHRATGRRCLFVDENLIPCPDQFLFLSKVERVDGEKLWKTLVGDHSTRDTVRRQAYVSPNVMKTCVKQLLAGGVERGLRNRIGHAIASELHRIGIVKDEARGVMKTWNLRNRPPLQSVELLTILDSAYSQVYEYGCGKGSLLRSVSECAGPDNCRFWAGQREGVAAAKAIPSAGDVGTNQPEAKPDGDEPRAGRTR